MFRSAQWPYIPLNVKEARGQIIDRDCTNVGISHEVKGDACPVLQASNISFEYEKKNKLLKNISLTLNKGEFLTVMGENGAGKSTLFKIISGLIDNYKGQVRIHGKSIKDMDTKERVKSIGYLSQNPNDYLGRNTVFDEVAYTLRNIGEFDSEKVEKMLCRMDLENLRDKNPRDLSGGEKQRTALACTIIADPEVLILDEPTRGMDWDSKETLGRYLRELCNYGTSVVLITHDVDFAADYTDNIALMFDGSIIASGECRDIVKDAIYYSPQAAKVFRGLCSIVKTSEAIECLKVIK
jgi:energy-coupling factor transport system ATP-binding protein